MENITENNRLIAGFMGYKLITPEMRRNPEKWYIKGKSSSYWENQSLLGGKKVLCSEHDLKYHSSWDWLMPVLHKCFAYDNLRMKQEINLAMFGYNNIEAVWLVVIKFIEWFNKEKK